jgi:hypothetical protein
VLAQLDEILGNKPAAPATFGRPELDPTGRKWY